MRAFSSNPYTSGFQPSHLIVIRGSGLVAGQRMLALVGGMADASMRPTVEGLFSRAAATTAAAATAAATALVLFLLATATATATAAATTTATATATSSLDLGLKERLDALDCGAR